MKKGMLLIFLFLSLGIFAQVNRFHEFPMFSPTHILDQKLDNVNFALSFRILVSDYNGPLVRL